MSVIRKVLVQSQNAPTSQTTVYQPAAGVTAVIDKISAHNTTVGALDISVNLIPAPDSAGSGNLLAKVTLAAGASFEFPSLTGHDLGSLDKLSVLASGSGITIRASGREFTSG